MWRGKGMIKWLALALALVVVAGGTTLFMMHVRTARQTATGIPALPVQTGGAATSAVFASYQEPVVSILPQVPASQVAGDLSNITDRARFQFSPDAQKMLADNGFVVAADYWTNPSNNARQPITWNEFYQIYENNTYSEIPSFVTTDSILHNYHLYFDHLLKTVEQQHLAPDLKTLTAGMLQASQVQYDALQGTAWKNAAKRNLAFFSVADQLLEPQAQVPAAVHDVVGQEIGLINQHSATAAVSPVMSMGEPPDELENLKEDYTQYIPRGHYDTSDDLRSYFRAMMWYGRLTFRAKNEDETKSAALISLALSEGGNYQNWQNIYEPTNFFVGKSDDITPDQYLALLAHVYGSSVSLQNLTGDDAKWSTFLTAAKGLNPPQINSIPIFNATYQPDRNREIMGMRFMGQRFTVDAYIFQNLIYRDVGENSQGDDRMLPKGLDIPAALGSSVAYNLLQQEGDTGYQGYPDNMAKLKQYLGGLDTGTWTQNLYWSWLYTLLPVLQAPGAGYPSFMQTTAWTLKGLNSFLGSWTELKHDTILYSKQVYAEMGGDDHVPPDYRGYVEPDPVCYARLAALVNMTEQGLEQRGLLDSQDKGDLDKLSELSLSLLEISEKELQNIPLTDDENDLIKSYGGQLEHFWIDVASDLQQSPDSSNPYPAAVVSDVATDPNGTVLEEGTGYISEIYVAVPVDGKLRIARGGIYSHYEFTEPQQNRLTDDQWRTMLQNNASGSGQMPALPDWTKQFMGGTGQVLPEQ